MQELPFSSDVRRVLFAKLTGSASSKSAKCEEGS